ncbi:hypothetical protein E4U17_001345, partial [Claviceps sp. LM77 group G4]
MILSSSSSSVLSSPVWHVPHRSHVKKTPARCWNLARREALALIRYGPPAEAPAEDELDDDYESPEVIFAEYKDAREKWYEDQLPGVPRTNAAYREAHCLPHLLSAYSSHNRRSGGRVRGACLAERIIEVREIPRWPESSSDGAAYVLHKSDLRGEDFAAPWLA